MRHTVHGTTRIVSLLAASISCGHYLRSGTSSTHQLESRKYTTVVIGTWSSYISQFYLITNIHSSFVYIKKAISTCTCMRVPSWFVYRRIDQLITLKVQYVLDVYIYGVIADVCDQCLHVGFGSSYVPKFSKLYGVPLLMAKQGMPSTHHNWLCNLCCRFIYELAHA
jgi:hypothetical protein